MPARSEQYQINYLPGNRHVRLFPPDEILPGRVKQFHINIFRRKMRFFLAYNAQEMSEISWIAVGGGIQGSSCEDD
jgi:hypothetical protein